MVNFAKILESLVASGVSVFLFLYLDLLTLGTHEAVAAPDGVRGAHLLSGGPVIVGEAAMRRKYEILWTF